MPATKPPCLLVVSASNIIRSPSNELSDRKGIRMSIDP